MRIVDVSEFYSSPGGGVRQYTDRKLRAARAHGHELVVIAPGPEDAEYAHQGGRVVWVTSPRLVVDPRYHVFTDAARTHAAITRLEPDLVEGSSVWSGGWFAAGAPVTCPKVLVFHQDPVAVYPQTFLDRWMSAPRIDRLCAPYWSFLRRLASHFTSTVTASSWLASRLTQQGLQHVRAVAFGSDPGGFSPTLGDPRLRRYLLSATDTASDGKLLVCVSRHHPEKRLHTLIDAVALLRREMQLGLVIFGNGPSSPWVERWARAAGGVLVYGFCGDRAWLARALASADALVHGSAAETYGIAVAEALRSGLPVVVPDRGGAADLAHPSCAEPYQAGDAADCARALRTLLARDAAASHAAAAARGRALRSESEHFDELFRYYASLVSQHGSGEPSRDRLRSTTSSQAADDCNG